MPGTATTTDEQRDEATPAATEEQPAAPQASSPGNVIEAILAVMREVKAVGKNERNEARNAGYSFRGIDATVNALGPAMRSVGLVVIPTVRDVTYEAITVGQNRTSMAGVRVKVDYTFYGPAGADDKVVASVVGEAMDSGDKGTAKAMSVAFRTALLQTFSLPTDERDPDADTFLRSDAPQSSREPRLPSPDEVHKALSGAAGNLQALYDVGNHYTQPVLAQVVLRRSDGSPSDAATIIDALIVKAQQDAAAAAPSAAPSAQVQDPPLDSEAANMVRDDDAQTEAHDGAAVY